MISASDRANAVQLILEAMHHGAGCAAACEALGITERTYFRWQKLQKEQALLASLWVRNAAFPCNQATLGTFDFRLGSGMRISEHTRYTISIMF